MRFGGFGLQQSRLMALDFQNPIGDAISGVRFASSSDNLLVSSWDSCLRLFDVGSSALRLEFQSESPLLDCCFKSDDVAFAADLDCSIRSYDLHSGRSEVIGTHDSLSNFIRYSSETGLLIATGLHKNILCLDTRMGIADNVSSLVNLEAEVDSMAISGFEVYVASQKSVFTYDLRNIHTFVRSQASDMGVRIKCVSSAPISKGFAVGSVDGRVALEMSFPANYNDIRYMFRCHPKSMDKRCHLVTVNDIVFNPLGGSAFFTGDNDGFVIAWDAGTKKRLFELPRYPNSVASLSINHSGELLAIASSFTYQEANEKEELPQIFIQEVGDLATRSVSCAS